MTQEERPQAVSLLPMTTVFLIKVNTNSSSSLRLSCLFCLLCLIIEISYSNSIILMLLLAMECLVKIAALKLIWPFIFGNGYCLEYKKLHTYIWAGMCQGDCLDYCRLL